jgi:glucokinase
MAYNLGIDLGGTNARAAVVDSSGLIVAAAKTQLLDRSPGAVVNAIAQAASEALSKAGNVPVDACGVGVAGQLQGDSGRVLVAPNLGWRDVPFGALLATRLERTVRVINDLNVAAWGELKAGAGKGASDLFVCFVGSGVGGALIIDSKLVSGFAGVAGEFGHIKVQPGGRLCGCGEHGCLEAYVGGHNLIAQMREVVEAGKSPRLLELAKGDVAGLNPPMLEKAAEEKDPAAVDIYERAAGHLALGIANQITVLNPARLIIGGGVLMHCPGLRKRIREGVSRYTARVSQAGFQVAEASLGDDSGLIGAALLASR